MSAQNNLEQVLKKIHIMISESPRLKGDMDKVVIDKNVLFAHLDELSRSFYDMLDEFELTKQKKKEAEYQMKQKYEQTVENAYDKAEDVYSASVLYTDEAITRIVRLIEKSEKSVEMLYTDLEHKLQREKDQIRANQKELQNQLFEMKDSNLYLNILNERRRQIEKEKAELEKAKKQMDFAAAPAYPKPEIKINKQYFEQMGLNEDGTAKEMEEKKPETPEVKVNLNSNYFKWKKGKEKGESNEPTGGNSRDRKRKSGN